MRFACFRVVPEPGHDGKNPAATGPDMLAKDTVLDLTRRLAKRLEAAGYAWLLTRDRNRAGSWSERYYLSNTDVRATIRFANMGEPTFAHNRPAASGKGGLLPGMGRFVENTAIAARL